MTGIADMGRELGDLWARTETLQVAGIEARRVGDGDRERDMARQEKVVWSRLIAIEAMMAESRAVTIEDAFAQFVVATGHVWGVDGAEMDKGCEEMIGQALKLLLSALAGFEQALGLDRGDFAGDTYATKQSDPHLVDVAA